MLVDTGTQWLGQIPAHWELSKIGHSFKHRNQTVSDKDFQPLSVTKNGVVPQLATAAKSDNSDGRKLIRKGDFVINQRSDRKGSAGVSHHDGSCSVIYTVLEPLKYDPRYAHHLFRSVAFQEEFYRWGTGIVDDLWSTRYSLMKQIACPVPPLEEQRAIADFLERELAQLDQLLFKNGELVSTLKIKKQAVIWDQLRIKAKSPDTGSRNSPVFEDIQTLYPLVPFKSIAKQRKSLVGDRWSSYQLLSLTRGGVITRDADSGVGKFPAEFDGYQVVEPMDLVFCLFDVAETPRTVGLVKEPGMITAAYTRYQLDRLKVDPEWLELLFIAIDDEKLFQPFYTGLRNTIPKGVLGSTLLPLPSLEEQQTAVETVKRTNEHLSTLMDTAIAFDSKLRERRDSLINLAVTGKIGLRGGN